MAGTARQTVGVHHMAIGQGVYLQGQGRDQQGGRSWALQLCPQKKLEGRHPGPDWPSGESLGRHLQGKPGCALTRLCLWRSRAIYLEEPSI